MRPTRTTSRGSKRTPIMLAPAAGGVTGGVCAACAAGVSPRALSPRPPAASAADCSTRLRETRGPLLSAISLFLRMRTAPPRSYAETRALPMARRCRVLSGLDRGASRKYKTDVSCRVRRQSALRPAEPAARARSRRPSSSWPAFSPSPSSSASGGRTRKDSVATTWASPWGCPSGCRSCSTDRWPARLWLSWPLSPPPTAGGRSPSVSLLSASPFFPCSSCCWSISSDRGARVLDPPLPPLRRPPQVDGLARLALERQRHLAPFSRRLVRRHHGLQHRSAVFAGDERLAVVLDAIDEVRHLAVEPVVPGLLVDGEAPPLGRSRLLDRVVVSHRAVGLDRVAVQEIGVGDALGAVHLGAVVHPAGLGPALLRDRGGAALELQEQDRVVLPARARAVQARAHLGIDGLDPRAAEHPSKELDGVTAHVHGDTAAGALDVPEVVGMGTVVLLGLLDQRGAAE